MNLTLDQQNALEQLGVFLLSEDPIMVIKGYAGTGKSTMIKAFMDDLENTEIGLKLIDPSYVPRTILMCAPTHKAVDVLRTLFLGSSPKPLFTTQSLFGMRLERQPNGTSKMVHSPRNVKFREHSLIIVDEASYIDGQLLSVISQCALDTKSKVVFMGDPAQLTPVESAQSPVFCAGFPEAVLTEIVRQDPSSKLQQMIADYRNSVSTGVLPSITVAPPEIHFVDDKDEAQQLLREEFCSGNWHPGASRVLAWTNQRVVAYNEWLEKQITGTPEFKVGQYYICNSGVTINQKLLPASSEVLIVEAIERGAVQLGVPGDWLGLSTSTHGIVRVFAPTDFVAWQAALRNWRKVEDFQSIAQASAWVDLRNLYASTVNKAQGSTYDKVFIDLKDISACRSRTQRARLMYVAASRARKEVVLFSF